MDAIIFETLYDAVKMLPFLFVAYLLIEYIEHHSSEKLEHTLKSSGKWGSVGGAILGIVPQCGFSAAAANLYAGRIITLGTLVAVFISTSDEAIPILLSNPEQLPMLLKLIGIKVVIAIIAGLIIDMVIKPKHEHHGDHIHEMCHDCGCEEKGVLRSALTHTFKMFIFIVAISFVLNLAMELIGEDAIAGFLLSDSLIQPFIAGLFGFIPNCISSVVMAQLYMSGAMSFGAVVAGLTTGAGVGIAVLFRVNKNLKENLQIAGILYIIGVGAGVAIQILGI